ncbi:hypothetical protein [Heyndrickxia ginsengihumi]|nr:hypothetical protein [Heyndrickxia ginsengihumi]MCM3024954.1 hypothetical protein [Heyndrickxia ginsengihumi]
MNKKKEIFSEESASELGDINADKIYEIFASNNSKDKHNSSDEDRKSK